MEYEIVSEPELGGDSFIVKTIKDGKMLTHYFEMHMLDIDYDGDPKWLNYIDDHYNRINTVANSHDFTNLKSYNGLKRDTVSKKNSKHMNHVDLIEKVKKVKK